MNIINLTGHPIKIIELGDKDHPHFIKGLITTIEPSEVVAKLGQFTKSLAPIEFNGIKIPVTQNYQGKVFFVPEPKPNTIYLVSKPVAMALPERDDLYVVNGLVRDRDGKVLGSRSIARITDNQFDSSINPHTIKP